ncbi:hypothetical protein BT69DRAFT_1097458 [Atractiella rhizophila]|nr:hypothetical protein BT69DRAFT_1097458 [Atractiella rhizophila]
MHPFLIVCKLFCHSCSCAIQIFHGIFWKRYSDLARRIFDVMTCVLMADMWCKRQIGREVQEHEIERQRRRWFRKEATQPCREGVYRAVSTMFGSKYGPQLARSQAGYVEIGRRMLLLHKVKSK